VFTFVDLFSGCGGLSLGLQAAGGKHILAVEKSPMASETYFENLIAPHVASTWDDHIRADIRDQAKQGLVVGPLSSVLADADLMKQYQDLEIDLVAGGPPCQGFSLAGRRQINDPRNKLAWEFLDFVRLANPKFVLIENVVGMSKKLAETSTRSPFDSLRIALGNINDGYEVRGLHLNAMHFGAPQSRPRLMLLGVRNDVAALLGVESSLSIWSSSFRSALTSKDGSKFLPEPTRSAKEVRTVGEAIGDLTASNAIGPRVEYLDEMQDNIGWKLPSKPISPLANHELRQHRAPTEDLFRLLQILTVNGALAAARRARAHDFSDEYQQPLQELLERLEYPVSSPDKASTFRSAEELLQAIRRRLTLKHSQTVLRWRFPSRTVVTIPDDYIHPLMARTFSVRELARLQGFPDMFVFKGKVTTGGLSRRVDVPQYSQVGNAVSPYVARAVGIQIATMLLAFSSLSAINLLAISAVRSGERDSAYEVTLRPQELQLGH
jgi:DNA (cytosine-5)-methyltransferase 1